jgi:hypothetical protein
VRAGICLESGCCRTEKCKRCFLILHCLSEAAAGACRHRRPATACLPGTHRPPGTWHPAPGTWHPAPGTWHRVSL